MKPGQVRCPFCQKAYYLRRGRVRVPTTGAAAWRVGADFPHETNDCAVRALAIGLDIPYREAHEALAAWGRRDKQGTIDFPGFCESYGLNQIYRRTTRASARTLHSLWPWMAVGRYIVLVKGHAFAVVDGVAQDTFACGKTRKAVRIWKCPDVPVQNEPKVL